MRVSYEGIGQWSATFVCDAATVGQVVKISGNGKVSDCSDGDKFGGVVLSVGRDGKACAVALGGMQTVDYSGDSAPALGWSSLSADGSGGVKADASGNSYLVVEVDTSAKTITFAL